MQEKLAREPANAWTDIKKLSGTWDSSKRKQISDSVNPDELNLFFARFEKPLQPIAAPPGNENAVKMDVIDPATTLAELKKLKPRKACGPDKLTPRLLKTCAQELAEPITNLYNSSLKQQQTPHQWKTALIKPLPKCSKPQSMKDYRPIALTSSLGKVLEKIIKVYIVANTILDPMQYAYQAKRSTQDAILCLLTHVATFIDNKAANHARCLLLDFSSAFNTICVNKLIEKLSYLDESVVRWIASFLSDQYQYTQVNNQMSACTITNTGTPQGTVLSPLLFSIYTDCLRAEYPNIKIIKYADDTVVIG